MNENKRILFAIMLTIICLCGIVFVILEKIEVEQQGVINYNEDNEEVKGDKRSQETIDEIVIVEEIYVQVSGAVVNPDVYKIIMGTRVFEVLEIAGGLRVDAHPSVVNQARVLKDEENIYFPTKAEVESGQYNLEGSSSLININNATKEQLTQLSGIGEAKAISIISYREKNGGFSSIEGIMNVPGIKESLFEVIKDSITI